MTEAQARRLRGVLLDSPDAAALELHGRVASAVLVALYVRDATLHAVLTLRRQNLRNHPGQVSFPGGRRDPTDPDLVHTALREAHEEIGLDPATVELLGALQPASTIVSGFAVYPFVGLIAPTQCFTPAPLEVATVLELPIPALAASYTRRTVTRGARSFRTDCYSLGGHLIWGATARILADLLERLALIDPGHPATVAGPLPADRRPPPSSEPSGP